ncbi:MAG: flagellar basal body P-ring formation chaperone FlgA [Planctomycetia bacterium]|nr:flagellar basal body P-ring formation chaperone FlgA [Planctomycetia bacterium]
MTNRTTTLAAFLFASLAIFACAADGAEVRLKAQARCRTGVVLLGDIAEVFAAEAWQTEQLRAIELGPAPSTGGRRFIRAREVQDALWMRGINLSSHQISGADRIEVTGPGEAVAAVDKPTFRPSSTQRERAEKTVSEFVLRYLRTQTTGREPYTVTATLSDEQVDTVLTYGSRLQVAGGMQPWTGKQRFTLATEEGAKQIRFDVDAEVGLPPGVVVALKSLPAGSIIHAGDVALKPVTSVNEGAQPFYNLEDVIGHETTWSIPVGTILGRNGIRRPQVVRRGDAVTLYARSAGLRVRTTVRAREDGSVGDLITVEALGNREPFYARVTGVQEAEVSADPAGAVPQGAATPEPRAAIAGRPGFRGEVR